MNHKNMLPVLEISSWKEESLTTIIEEIKTLNTKPLILIDGAGGSGKTTIAKAIAEKLDANLVHSDDVSWWADPIEWDTEMKEGIINPWNDGKDVSYRPSGWIKKDRAGSIKVDSSKPLIIEGNGSCRKSLREISTFSIWVDTDPIVSRERIINRDMEEGVNGGTYESVKEFAEWWDGIITPFFLKEEPWKYVSVIISGEKGDITKDKIAVSIPNLKANNYSC